MIDDEEIKKVAPKTANVMEILEFVKGSEVDSVYLESSYYTSPEAGGGCGWRGFGSGLEVSFALVFL